MNLSLPKDDSSKTFLKTLLLWSGFILVSINLRLIFATVGPLLIDLNLNITSTLLVTTLPLALLGIFSIPGVYLRRKWGEERTLFFALCFLTIGCSVRWFGETNLIIGTIIGSAGIAIMNVIMPALARKRFGSTKMGFVMGIYALMIGVGAVIGASGSIPLFHFMGADFKAAYHSLGLWGIPAFLTLIIWLPQLKYGAMPIQPIHPQSLQTSTNVYRHKTAWSITLFFGLQALNLYVFLAWMPTILIDRGASQNSAAFIFSLSQVSLMVASFIIPLLASRKPDQRLWITITVLCGLLGTLGLMYAPYKTAIIWALFLGFGQGAGPALGAFLFVAKSSNVDTAARLSAMAQTIGYLIAIIGPLLIGLLYYYLSDWNIPIIILALILILELIVSLPAGKDIKI